MKHTNYIRNVFITGHVDHGSSTVFKMLKDKSGLKCGLKPRESTELSSILYYELQSFTGSQKNPNERVMDPINVNPNTYFFKLFKMPGNIDFSLAHANYGVSKSDTVIIVVDCIQGIATQTIQLLHYG